MEPTPPLEVQLQEHPGVLRRVWRKFDTLFAVFVLVPTLLAAVYYGFIASDVYVSESRFVVRSPQRPAQGGLGALLSGTVFSRSQDDTYSVHDYIRSRDALTALEQSLSVRRMFSSPDIDFASRFAGLSPWRDSFEAFHKYYQSHIQIGYDSVSSITELQVRAYSAADARRINEALLEMGEKLVNQMNLRSRRDLIEVAEQEVKLAEGRAKAAAVALSGFRSDRGVFDPDRQSAIQLQSLARLREELALAQSQLNQVRQVSPTNPQIPVLQSRVESINATIAAENAGVTGRQGGLATKSPEYDRLALERTFADRQLGTALAALDSARSEAARKQLYLERLVQPNLPDDALEPRRLRAVLTVLAVGLAVWGVLSMVLATVREHTA